MSIAVRCNIGQSFTESCKTEDFSLRILRGSLIPFRFPGSVNATPGTRKWSRAELEFRTTDRSGIGGRPAIVPFVLPMKGCFADSTTSDL